MREIQNSKIFDNCKKCHKLMKKTELRKSKLRYKANIVRYVRNSRKKVRIERECISCEKKSQNLNVKLAISWYEITILRRKDEITRYKVRIARRKKNKNYDIQSRN